MVVTSQPTSERSRRGGAVVFLHTQVRPAYLRIGILHSRVTGDKTTPFLPSLFMQYCRHCSYDLTTLTYNTILVAKLCSRVVLLNGELLAESML